MAVGVAILGAGIFVTEEHLPAVKKAEGASLKAIWSRSKATAEKCAADEAVDIYSEESEGKDLDALLARDDVQAIIIALPITRQPDIIRKALLAKKHVISEKPIAKDVETAQALLKWYNEEKSQLGGATWAIAENFRFLEAVVYAREQIAQLGKILQFEVRILKGTKLGTKYIETSWRKVPDYQGGFLLDGGIHEIAATRYLLGAENPLTQICAQTAQVQEHLPPLDTAFAACKTSTGIPGTIHMTFGSTRPGINEYSIMCEKGSITVTKRLVVTRLAGQAEVERQFPLENDVELEIAAWVKGIAEGKMDERQTPEAALKDLEILEAIFKSGEQGGAPQQVSA